jgi:DNA polymerase III delta prime subunit
MAIKIDWNQFKVKNENYRKSFEDLCYYLFCRRFCIKEGIKVDYNNIGLETYPFYNKETKKSIGFQSKFFDNKLSDSSSKKQIIDSIKKAKKNYKDLDKIIIYTHLSFGSKNPKYKQEIEKEAGKTEIEWFIESNFEILLNQPSNLDLTQLYFDVGDELGFIKNSCNPKILTFLQSSEYLDLPFKNTNKVVVKDVKYEIFYSPKKEFLITGHPGSGKTIFMHKLLQEFGGLNKKNESEMIKLLQKNNAVPMLINLKNCTTDSLENILRGRQNDSKVRGKQFGFIYLFDGLDELSGERADNVLLYIYELEQSKNTKKIIFSCRSGNLNKIKSKMYFPKITEYQIDDLGQEYIVQYFDAKNNSNKNDKLQHLQKENDLLVKDIKDILLIQLLWDTIDELDKESVIIDLLEKKIYLLLNNSEHRKNIEELNLLNPKEEEIIALNQNISFELQKKFQFRFPQKDLQKLILNNFPRLDYKSANIILNYLADLFFENAYSNVNQYQDFIYQHRRYQEFFLAQKLKYEYEKNPRILRDLKILSNNEFFENMFLKYLKKEYEKEKNLPGLVELNLIDVYLDQYKGYGADKAYYMDSGEFIPSLAYQGNLIFEELLADENLKIKEKILIDLKDLKKIFEKWRKDKKNYFLTDYLKNIWESGISSLLKNIVIFYKANKKNIVDDLLRDLDKVTSIFEENKFLENMRDDEDVRDPFWNQWEDWIYIRIVIDKESSQDIFNRLIRDNYPNFSNERDYGFEESGKDKLVKSFIRVCLECKRENLFKLIDVFNEYEFLIFLNVLSSIDALPVFVEETSIHDKIKVFLKSFSQEITEKNSFILFYKKFFNISLSQEEIDFANTEIKKLREKDGIHWRVHKTHLKYALLSYALEIISFEKLLRKSESHLPQYYVESVLFSALFKDFIGLLQKKKNIEMIVRNYISYINTKNEVISELYLKKDISILWASIFVYSNLDSQKLLNLKIHLINKKNNIVPFNFCFKLKQLNPILFNKIINENNLEDFEKNLESWNNDFPSYVNRCFGLALLFEGYNKQKVISCISKGINEGIVRHGWRKDIIVSSLLVDALEILWRNNWESKENLIGYTNKVFQLSLRVIKITDGDGTWRGPYNVVDLVANYDIDLAEKFKKELIENEEYYNLSNEAITSVLIGKINLGLAIENIEKGMEEYGKDYNYKGKPSSSYYEQKFKVYLAIAQCNSYTENEKKNAFEKAYEQVEEMIKQKLNHNLGDLNFKKEKLEFLKLCDRYSKKYNVSFDVKEKQERKPKISENDFIQEFKKAKTIQKIRGLYKRLENYNNDIVLKKTESWKILVNKNFEVYGNIDLFVKLLRNNLYPHMDFYSSNSKYLHFGLAAALNNINTKQEIIKYLSKNAGHGGFVNIMKAYEVNGDKAMCLQLFKRYLRFCDFLVN